jgi:hypothetical protein
MTALFANVGTPRGLWGHMAVIKLFHPDRIRQQCPKEKKY